MTTQISFQTFSHSRIPQMAGYNHNCKWYLFITTDLRPQLYGLWSPRQPFPRGNLSSVHEWKRSLCMQSQSWLCMIIHNPYWIIKCADIPLSLSFPWSFNHSGFCQVNFPVLILISALNPKSRHYTTLATWHIWRKVVLLARAFWPAETRQLSHPRCLAPWDEFAILM